MSASLDEHVGYVADVRRTELFRAALGEIIRPGDLVADIGCGSGILGLLCLKSGAACVWGIDQTDMIEATRETMARAGLAGRYVCIRDNSRRACLPEPVDVIICDHVGFFGFDYGILGLLADAQRRFLKPGGRIIPSAMRLELAAVESPAAWAKATAWDKAGIPAEFRWLRGHGLNQKYAVTLGATELLGAPAVLATIDFTKDQPDFMSFETDLKIIRNGTMHGVAGWFGCSLSPNVVMTNSPVDPGRIDRHQAFLPVGEPIEVTAGEYLAVSIKARPEDDLIAWSIQKKGSTGRNDHSTWKSRLLSPGQLGVMQPGRALKLSPLARARHIVSGYCDGCRTAAEIELMVLRDHPDLFPSEKEIKRFILQTLRKDCE